MDYLHSQRVAMGFEAEDIEDLAVTDRYRTSQTGLTHLYLRQRIDGIPVEGAEISMAVDAQGRLVSLGDRLERGLHRRVATRQAALSAADAALAASLHLGLEPNVPLTAREASGGPAGAFLFPAAGVSRDDIPVKRVYVVEDGSARLAWNVVVRTPDGRHWWNLYVDAVDGRVLRQNDWIAHDAYEVLPPPLASPDEGPRSLEVNPADATASPVGWHVTNGSAGAEFTDTRGNNVFAQEDIDADDLGGLRPDGGAGLVFDFPLDLTLQPGNSIDASVSNLFYWNNVLHDVLYQYGFDEPAGNFQSNNYGNGGAAGDPVQADTQDGSDVYNAQFGTPPDGVDPRMEMFRWSQGLSPRVIVSSPPVIAGTYSAGFAFFGAGTAGLAGNVVQALDPADGAGPTTTDACSPLTNPGAVFGNIAILDRGTCTFVVKLGHAQDAGATGAIVVNNAGDSVVNMSGIEPTIVIPSVFLGQSDGSAIVGQLGSGVSADLVSPAARDSSLDNGVVAHEYGHGVSNRLTGGPANVNCLSALESRGMGEGWSDFLALVFTAMPGDLDTDARGVAPYLIGQPPTGGGIRNFPYSTDLVASPLTYGDISSLNWPHGVGEVWAASLWEMYWLLVEQDGFDPDLYAGTGGNNAALQLVLDGMKLQPCNPTFVTGRDALLAAEANSSGGANECLIWEAFAKRGVGLNADDGGSAASLAVTEDFDLPATCVPEPGTATLLLSGCGLLLALERRRMALVRES
jgi:extracellular elastinolytic metalloproteinase